jgi:cellulose synthase/poly-beta-1,6-N-acetylglucosamine synthase-like glycosyltransferase
MQSLLTHAAPIVFWLSVLFIAYTYFVYPLLAALLARIRPRPIYRGDYEPFISIVVAAYNEGDKLARRLENLAAQDYPAGKVEIIVASDGSTDNTGEVLTALMSVHPNLRPIILEHNRGKGYALNTALEIAEGEIVVFADARQAFAPDVLRRLAENFADPAIGSASGELLLTDGETGVAAQVGLYWKYEKWIRRSESAFGSMLGATGAIYAIRCELYRPLPMGILLDDFLTPMRIVLAGGRAIFDDRAIATDAASTRAGQEFRRKRRTLAGNFQAFALEPGLLIPWRNPATWLQVWSHKLFRLMVPWAMIGALLGALAAPGRFFDIMVLVQEAFYALALLGWQCERRGRAMPGRLVSLAYTFVTLNLAALTGLWVWLRDKGSRQVWVKAYTPSDRGQS